MRRYFCDRCGKEEYLYEITVNCNFKGKEKEFCQSCFESIKNKLLEILLEEDLIKKKTNLGKELS
jgi:hypothetical protein